MMENHTWYKKTMCQQTKTNDETKSISKNQSQKKENKSYVQANSIG